MLFSILIPTLVERRPLFEKMYAALDRQIQAAGLKGDVEIISLCDAREQTLGVKRNVLMGMAQGEFTAFVDDDDVVSDAYVRLICDALRAQPDVDCVGITGQVYFRGAHPHRFIYSLRYGHYFSRGGGVLSPALYVESAATNHRRAVFVRKCEF